MCRQGKRFAAVVREADLRELHSLMPVCTLTGRETELELQTISHTIRRIKIRTASDMRASTATSIKTRFKQSQRPGRRIQQLPRAGIDGRERGGQHAGDDFVIDNRLTRA